MIYPRMLNWLPISHTFFSLPQITFRSRFDAMTGKIQSGFAPLISLLGTNPTGIVEMMKLRMFIILHRLPASLKDMVEWYTAIDPRHYMGKWYGMWNTGRSNGTWNIWRWVLLVCEIGIVVMIIWNIKAYYLTPAHHSTPADTVSMEQAAASHESETSPNLDQVSPQARSSVLHSGSSSKYSSTSTNRTSSTTATNTSSNTSNDNISEYVNQANLPDQNRTRIPPHRILEKYICPKYSSTWPPYYLQAFHKAQESALKEGNIHVDAPTSSGTRNNKDGCVGKIVLDRRVVKRDVKDGVVIYREGITGTVSYGL